ncbi:hypothetical protein DSUL_50315 [Desulfovibrionales bacterium]
MLSDEDDFYSRIRFSSDELTAGLEKRIALLRHPYNLIALEAASFCRSGTLLGEVRHKLS